MTSEHSSTTAHIAPSSNSPVNHFSSPPSPVISSPPIGERLDGSNYLVWKTLLIPFLKANHLMGIVNGSEPAPPKFLSPSSPSSSSTVEIQNPAYTTWSTRDQTALGWLLATSSKSIITQLSNHTTSASAWTYLATSYAAQSTARAASLRIKLQSIRKGNMTVTEYIQHATALADQLATVGEHISDTEYHTHLFRGLGSDFSSLATAISVHTQTQPLSRDALHRLLLSHEGRLDLAHDTPPPPAAFASYPGQFQSPRHTHPPPLSPHPQPYQNYHQPGLLPNPTRPPQQYSQRGGRGRRRGGPFCQLCCRPGHIVLHCRERFNP